MKVQSVFFFSLAAIAAAFEAGITDADNIPVPTPVEHFEDEIVDGPLVTGEVVFDDATNEYEYSEGDFEGNTDQDLADYFKQDFQGDAENPEDIHKLMEHIKEKKCPKKKCLNKIVKTKTCYVTLHKLHYKTVKKPCPAPTKHIKKPTKKPMKQQPSKKQRCPNCGSSNCDGGNQCPNKGNNKKQQSKKQRCPNCGSTDCDGGSTCPNKKNNKGNKNNKNKNNKNNKAQRCPNCGSTDCGGCSGNNNSQCPNCGSRNCGGDC